MIPTRSESERTVWEAACLVASCITEWKADPQDYDYFTRLHYPECDASFVTEVGYSVRDVMSLPAHNV